MIANGQPNWKFLHCGGITKLTKTRKIRYGRGWHTAINTLKFMTLSNQCRYDRKYKYCLEIIIYGRWQHKDKQRTNPPVGSTVRLQQQAAIWVWHTPRKSGAKSSSSGQCYRVRSYYYVLVPFSIRVQLIWGVCYLYTNKHKTDRPIVDHKISYAYPAPSLKFTIRGEKFKFTMS